MHEYSTNPDVVARLRDETEWAIRYRRRNVELSPDDAVALQARVELLTAALTELISEVARRGWANDHEVLDPARAVLSATPTEPVQLKASQIPTEPGVPSKRVSRGSRSYWAAIREAEASRE